MYKRQVINLILSVLLIPIIGVYGAVVGSVSAEIFGLLVQMVICRKFVKATEILKELIPFILIGFLMMLGIKYVDMMGKASLIELGLELIVGGLIYCILTGLYILCFRKDIKESIMNKMNL